MNKFIFFLVEDVHELEKNMAQGQILQAAELQPSLHHTPWASFITLASGFFRFGDWLLGLSS